LEKEVGKLKLQKRKIWDYFYFSDPDGDGTDQRMDRLSISAMSGTGFLSGGNI